MTITAKFASVCPHCGTRITPGTQVEWSRGSQARHVACGEHGTTTVTMPRPRRQTARSGRRTGCSCGSREDASGRLIPSPRNCRSCEHDA